MQKPNNKRAQSEQKLAKLLGANKLSDVSIAELRHNSAAVVSRVAIGGERIVLTRNRKPVAALVPMDDFNSLGKSRKKTST